MSIKNIPTLKLIGVIMCRTLLCLCPWETSAIFTTQEVDLLTTDQICLKEGNDTARSAFIISLFQLMPIIKVIVTTNIDAVR